MSLDTLVDQLKKDEGRKVADLKHRLYKCPADKWTIGYGRNLEDNGITEAEATSLLVSDAMQAQRDAADLVPNWVLVDDVRQDVLANMAYNMGRSRLSGFVKMLAAVNDGRYKDAAAEMRASKWYAQVGNRSKRLADEMETGIA